MEEGDEGCEGCEGGGMREEGDAVSDICLSLRVVAEHRAAQWPTGPPGRRCSLKC